MPFDFWRVNAEALGRVRDDVTGYRFTEFVNSLLSTEALYSGLPLSAVRLNLQINLHDGGADAAVDNPVPSDSTGWLGCPTVWQFKRSRLADGELRTEIAKESVRQHIENGYSYRLCVCEEEAPPEIERKEAVLADAQRSINQEAPLPRLLTASRLASWVNKYPALILTYFHPGYMGNFLDLNTWKKNITWITPTFLLADEWKTTFNDLRRYVDFSVTPASVPFLLKGEAGVGKTRLVFESLASIPGSEGLVIYCTDEQESCAGQLAMSQEVRAILVADECDVQTRENVKSTLVGFKDRVRVVAINAEDPSRSGGREYFLKQLPSNDVAEVLKTNFGEVSEESRRRYAELCEGFVGLAADMCRNDPEIRASGDLSPVMQSAETYYLRRLPEDQRKHIEAIALVTRVGFKREKESELDTLCELCRLDPER